MSDAVWLVRRSDWPAGDWHAMRADSPPEWANEWVRYVPAAELAESESRVLARDARIAELERAQQWQTIETAPADVPLLLYCPDRGPANEERFECREYRNTRGGTQHAWATHWMPLPEAPKP